jgi:hypothetical protein
MGGIVHSLNNKGRFYALDRVEIIEPKKRKLNACDSNIFKLHNFVLRVAIVITHPLHQNTIYASACQTVSVFP